MNLPEGSWASTKVVVLHRGHSPDQLPPSSCSFFFVAVVVQKPSTQRISHKLSFKATARGHTSTIREHFPSCKRVKEWSEVGVTKVVGVTSARLVKRSTFKRGFILTSPNYYANTSGVSTRDLHRDVNSMAYDVISQMTTTTPRPTSATTLLKGHIPSISLEWRARGSCSRRQQRPVASSLYQTFLWPPPSASSVQFTWNLSPNTLGPYLERFSFVCVGWGVGVSN